VVSELRLHRAAHGRGRRGRLAETQVDEEGPSSPPQPKDVEEDDNEDDDDEGLPEATGKGAADGGEVRSMPAASVEGVPGTVDKDTKQVAVENAKRILVEKQMDLVRDFPGWSMNSGLADAAKGHGQDGLWRANRGPPYVEQITMFGGKGVDKKGSGNLVRRVVGLKTSFRFHKWEGNSFLSNFDGPQFRYLYRNVHSSLIIPPLETGGGWVRLLDLRALCAPCARLVLALLLLLHCPVGSP
jgi:hypothetical protein